jgi:hypothetical protein
MLNSVNARTLLNLACCLLILVALVEPAFAAGAGGATKTQVSTFVCDILGIVRVVGYAVVAIAVFVFGYQVSFGGKRPSEAAPILVGGIIIGISGILSEFLVSSLGANTTICP